MSTEQLNEFAARIEGIAAELEYPYSEQRNDLYQIVDEMYAAILAHQAAQQKSIQAALELAAEITK